MKQPLNDDALDQLFRRARTYNAWLNKPVSDDILRRLYDLMKRGPTSANSCPARVLFFAPERQRSGCALFSRPGTWTRRWPHRPPPSSATTSASTTSYRSSSRIIPACARCLHTHQHWPETTAFRNGTLQGAYFILAARSLGLDCGPMSGFDNAGVDTEFFAPICKEVTATEVPTTCSIRSNFLCNLGYGDPAKLYPPNPRLDFEEACRLL